MSTGANMAIVDFS